jgi:hypothetical protein
MQLRRDSDSRMCEQMRAGPASKELKSADELETIKKENPVIMLNAGLVISTMSRIMPWQGVRVRRHVGMAASSGVSICPCTIDARLAPALSPHLFSHAPPPASIACRRLKLGATLQTP